MDEKTKLIKPTSNTFIKNILSEPIEPLFKEVQIYTYKFPNGKIYIGYTSYGLEYVDNFHKSFSVSPICQYLNNPETYVKPNEEIKVTVNVYGDEIHKIQRKILDKYTTDTTQILNKNLYLFGY